MKTPIHLLLDLQYVKRWNMIGVSMEDTVAAHSFRVAMIAMAIREAMDGGYDPSWTEQAICYYALIHDVKECHTGDVPTPTKRKMEDHGFDINNIQYDHPDEDRPEHRMENLIKIADLVDAWVFLRVHGVGSRSAECADGIYASLTETIDKSDMAIRRAAKTVLGDITRRRKTDGSNKERIDIAEESKGRYPFPVGC